ncbi:MAG: carbohydrate kinase family protein [Candidatus Acidiferrales bacterium]
MPRPDVCVVGEINPDLILYGLPKEIKPEQETLVEGFRLTLGSSSAIFAHNLAVLGTHVGIVSQIGDDAFGKMAVGWLEAGGVDVAHVSTAKTTGTGLSVILAHPHERFILTYPGTMFELSYPDLDFDYILSTRHLHLSSFFLHRALRPQIPELFRRAKERGLTTSLDTNDDPEDRWGGDLQQVLKYVDIFFPNEREAKKIAQTEDLNQAIAQLSQTVPLVVVKLGPQGALARKGSQEWRAPRLRVNAIDVVGAGDSFDAGFIHRFLEGAGIEESLKFANIAGAFSTTREGGTEAFRNREEVTRFFRDQSAGK